MDYAAVKGYKSHQNNYAWPCSKYLYCHWTTYFGGRDRIISFCFIYYNQVHASFDDLAENLVIWDFSHPPFMPRHEQKQTGNKIRYLQAKLIPNISIIILVPQIVQTSVAETCIAICWQNALDPMDLVPRNCCCGAWHVFCWHRLFWRLPNNKIRWKCILRYFKSNIHWKRGGPMFCPQRVFRSSLAVITLHSNS